MQPPPAKGRRPPSAPTFYVTASQPVRPAAVLLAMLVAAAVASALIFGLGHSRARHFSDERASASRSPSTGHDDAAKPDKEEKDDPSQVDTIVLGDAADAPVPARRGDRVSDVHATIIVRLPRFGEQVGLIPDNAAGHLLYRWLAAFNQGSSLALEQALPNSAPDITVAAQMVLRQQTGGFNLLSAREVRPGVMVFRLRDQTPDAAEVLGTLQVRPGSSPPALASFSLRAVPPAARGTGATTRAAGSPH